MVDFLSLLFYNVVWLGDVYMQIDKITNFLNDSQLISNYNILLTDLNKIIVAKPSHIEDLYLFQHLSDKLLQILLSFNYDNRNNQKYLFVNPNTIIPLLKHDYYTYSSEIILPIYNKNKLFGSLIFFSNNKIFLASNLNYALTTKTFVEKIFEL